MQALSPHLSKRGAGSPERGKAGEFENCKKFNYTERIYAYIQRKSRREKKLTTGLNAGVTATATAPRPPVFFLRRGPRELRSLVTAKTGDFRTTSLLGAMSVNCVHRSARRFAPPKPRPSRGDGGPRASASARRVPVQRSRTPENTCDTVQCGTVRCGPN